MLFVEPYPYVYATYVKQRWLGKSLLFILIQEFSDYSAEYFNVAMKNGIIKLLRRGILISNQEDIIIKDLDIIIHFVHRHESPVFEQPTITDSQLTINNNIIQLVYKPSGMPVHPSSHYQKNSLINHINGKFINRLDKLVAGSMLCCKDAQTAEQVSILFQNRDVIKIYVAQVNNLGNLNGIYAVFNKILEGDQINERSCEQGDFILKLESHEQYLQLKEQKYHSLSIIQVDNNSALCYPVTGRTHQLRIHLQELNCPIINDPLYGGLKEELLKQIHHISPQQTGFDFHKDEFEVLLRERLSQIKGLKYLNIDNIMNQFNFPENVKCWQCGQMSKVQQTDQIFRETNGRYNIINPYSFIQKRIDLQCVFYYINYTKVQGCLPEWFPGNYEVLQKKLLDLLIQ
ncbi:tRNA pseudouridine32 synthase [Spironucleus salmonicida]|uniref:tRNA pseudouridine synthase n=1 Tax=Spironucleus salmonicida TaxID=348837 RepID=V6LB61_9EUKA|nr:tRNA pseudouridine32 synthase [Spironucleus salmonicida]|eukprot:EST41652.1 tRNA pseudouridine synthase [Spironucleus salmonicida]